MEFMIVRIEIFLLLVNLCACFILSMLNKTKIILCVLLGIAIIQYLFIEWNSLLGLLFRLI